MTVPTSTGVDRYTGNGATSTFSYTFYIQDDDDVQVIVINTSTRARTVLTKTTHYTVSGAGDSAGGSVTLISPWNNLSSSYKIVLKLNVDPNNSSAFRNGNINGGSLEDAMDRMSQRVIELEGEVARAVKLPDDEAGTVTLTNLGAATDRASKVLTFDASGNVSAASSIPEGSLAVTAIGETIVEAANAGAVLDALGFTTFTKTLVDDTTAANFLTTLGVTATGQDIIDSANAAAARTAIGLDAASGAITSLDIADAATAQIFQARVTPVSGSPAITVPFVAGDTITTLYLTPYKGNKIAVYNGTRWKLMPLTQISIAVPATTVTMYDLFVYDNAGTLTLEALAWTNDTTRATALAYQDGVLCKTGALTRRYVGSFRTNGSSGNTSFNFGKIFIWNYYNRISLGGRVVDTTNNWDYTTATIRQANGAAGNKIEFVVGVYEDVFEAYLVAHSSNTNAAVARYAALMLDSVTAISATTPFSVVQAAAASIVPHTAFLSSGGQDFSTLTAGYHYVAWLEYSAATGTTTWYGDNGGTCVSGLTLRMLG